MPSIAELLLAQGAQAAETRRRLGEIQGQMWSGIGHDISQIPGQIEQQKRLSQENELRSMQLTQARQQQAGQGVLDQAMQSYTPSGPQEEGQPPAAAQHPYLDENGLWDVSKLQGVLADRGMAHLAPDLLKSAENINDSITKHQAAQQKEAETKTILYGDLADGASKLTKAGTPLDQAMDLVAQPALASKRINPQEYQQLKQHILSLPPDQQQAALQSAMDAAERVAPSETLAEGAKRVGRYGRTIAENAPKPPPVGQGEYTINGQRFKADGTPIGAVQPPQTPPKAYQKSSVMLDGKPAEILTDPTPGGKVYDLNGAVIANPAQRIKPIPPAGQIINPALVPSGDALTMAARRYLATGDLPAMGMGQSGAAARVAVMNEAAKIDPAASLAQNRATFQADSANLKKLQTTEGTLSAFEKTAGKNLDQFLSLADKIPDTGVPWLNQPIRSINAKLLGSSDQAAFNAARDVALREIARVTNDPKLSGVLSDSARQEVSQLSPANATFAQIKAVAKVLKQDMANVHAGVNEQISTVKSGIGQMPGQAPNPSSGNSPKRIRYDENGNRLPD